MPSKKKIFVFTKERHIEKIRKFLDILKLEYEIFTSTDKISDNKFDLGISYCYPKKIKNPLLSKPRLGFVNFHPGPLPEYKGPYEYENAIKNKEIKWGVSAHYMNEEFDTGEIIEVYHFDLHENPKTISELGAISHYFLFELFKKKIPEILKVEK